MQIASIILTLFPLSGMAILSGQFDVPMEFIHTYPAIAGNTYSISVALYNTWQTIYVIHLLLSNIKRLNIGKRDRKRELDDMLPNKNAHKANPGLNVSTDHLSRLDDEQNWLTKKLIASCIIGFCFLIVVVVSVLMGDTMDADGNLDLSGSWVYQMSFIFGTLN